MAESLQELNKMIKTSIKDVKKNRYNISLWQEIQAVIVAMGAWDKVKALAYNKMLKKELPQVLRYQSLSAKEFTQCRELYRKCLLFAAQDDLDSYLLYLEWNRPANEKFYQPRRNILRVVVDDLQDLADNKLDFLAISLPTRVGKSTLGIFFLTWLMGRNPDSANAVGGHSGILTGGFYDEILNVITDKGKYLFLDVFPAAILVDKSAKETTINLKSKKRFSTVTCRGIDGTWTGAIEVGNDGVLYCDDLIEDIEEAENLDRLESKYKAYLNQMKDRKKKGARELHIGTRWAVSDVIGRIQEQYEENDRYRFRVIPAIDENGESNFDYPYNLGYDTAHYKDMEASIDPAEWCSKFMGDPFVREGLAFPVEELRRYEELPKNADGEIKEPDLKIAVCDTKDRGKDYASMPIAWVYGQDYYIVDTICDNALSDIVNPRLATALVSNKVNQCRFESNAAGGSIADKVGELVEEQNWHTDITKKFTSENKEAKIITRAGWIKRNCIFKDNHIYSKRSDYGRMMRFLTQYSMSGKNKFDDVPDSFAMLAQYVESLQTTTIKVSKRPF